ncbi:hypothetical protein A2Y83_01415 [Candidatus Falkowbacteria bacterium RBG_13_39_14]|uniref:Addiction module toxin RelE n=1 Tax=Candidatus Falkowbacteria bacterium RBG_13_39_14 TaxID=1797985 RepID=A0A1F5S9S0_9BACT|nr:MAG: hypothetical protein A2Y83_01415 [Candidatus Falkowbacteria bacterium RBG_13_39_14]
MAYRIVLKKKAEKELGKIPKGERYKVLAVIAELAREPYLGKKLEGEFAGLYSIRVWPYRMIYTIYKKELLIIIIRIGHRQGVYK